MAGTKKAIPNAERRALARRYGCEFGYVTTVPCHYCGKPGRISWTQARYWPHFEHQIDHVVPESLGGASVVENFVLACQPCNGSKGARG